MRPSRVDSKNERQIEIQNKENGLWQTIILERKWKT